MPLPKNKVPHKIYVFQTLTKYTQEGSIKGQCSHEEKQLRPLNIRAHWWGRIRFRNENEADLTTFFFKLWNTLTLANYMFENVEQG